MLVNGSSVYKGQREKGVKEVFLRTVAVYTKVNGEKGVKDCFILFVLQNILLLVITSIVQKLRMILFIVA